MESSWHSRSSPDRSSLSYFAHGLRLQTCAVLQSTCRCFSLTLILVATLVIIAFLIFFGAIPFVLFICLLLLFYYGCTREPIPPRLLFRVLMDWETHEPADPNLMGASHPAYTSWWTPERIRRALLRRTCVKIVSSEVHAINNETERAKCATDNLTNSQPSSSDGDSNDDGDDDGGDDKKIDGKESKDENEANNKHSEDVSASESPSKHTTIDSSADTITSSSLPAFIQEESYTEWSSDKREVPGPVYMSVHDDETGVTKLVCFGPLIDPDYVSPSNKPWKNPNYYSDYRYNMDQPSSQRGLSLVSSPASFAASHSTSAPVNVQEIPHYSPHSTPFYDILEDTTNTDNGHDSFVWICEVPPASPQGSSWRTTPSPRDGLRQRLGGRRRGRRRPGNEDEVESPRQRRLPRRKRRERRHQVAYAAMPDDVESSEDSSESDDDDDESDDSDDSDSKSTYSNVSGSGNTSTSASDSEGDRKPAAKDTKSRSALEKEILQFEPSDDDDDKLSLSSDDESTSDSSQSSGVHSASHTSLETGTRVTKDGSKEVQSDDVMPLLPGTLEGTNSHTYHEDDHSKSNKKGEYELDDSPGSIESVHSSCTSLKYASSPVNVPVESSREECKTEIDRNDYTSDEIDLEACIAHAAEVARQNGVDVEPVDIRQDFLSPSPDGAIQAVPAESMEKVAIAKSVEQRDKADGGDSLADVESGVVSSAESCTTQEVVTVNAAISADNAAQITIGVESASSDCGSSSSSSSSSSSKVENGTESCTSDNGDKEQQEPPTMPQCPEDHTPRVTNKTIPKLTKKAPPQSMREDGKTKFVIAEEIGVVPQPFSPFSTDEEVDVELGTSSWQRSPWSSFSQMQASFQSLTLVEEDSELVLDMDHFHDAQNKSKEGTGDSKDQNSVNMHTHKEEGEEADDDNTSVRERVAMCDICLLPLSPGEVIAWSRNPNCGHAYHEECIVDWLLRKPTCPSCREIYIRPKDCDEDGEVPPLNPGTP
jgi:Ring finger domain